jgi:hypothetical protein
LLTKICGKGIIDEMSFKYRVGPSNESRLAPTFASSRYESGFISLADA